MLKYKGTQVLSSLASHWLAEAKDEKTCAMLALFALMHLPTNVFRGMSDAKSFLQMAAVDFSLIKDHRISEREAGPWRCAGRGRVSTHPVRVETWLTRSYLYVGPVGGFADTLPLSIRPTKLSMFR